MSSDWRRHAACAEALNPDLFVSPGTVAAARVVARVFCADCPVRAECLAAAEGSGIWGGHWFPVGRGHRVGRPVDLLAPQRWAASTTGRACAPDGMRLHVSLADLGGGTP